MFKKIISLKEMVVAAAKEGYKEAGEHEERGKKFVEELKPLKVELFILRCRVWKEKNESSRKELQEAQVALKEKITGMKKAFHAKPGLCAGLIEGKDNRNECSISEGEESSKKEEEPKSVIQSVMNDIENESLDSLKSMIFIR